MTFKFDDEICQCGHSKGYHTKTSLDIHGGSCEKCKCTLYTWLCFVKYGEAK
jgi:DNA-nicking Smr family endonuclease